MYRILIEKTAKSLLKNPHQHLTYLEWRHLRTDLFYQNVMLLSHTGPE